jgi:hypothetical protein
MLPGGGALRLVKAHYAPTYHDVRPIGLMERFKGWLPKQRNVQPPPVGSRDYGKAGDPPRLWLVFEADGVKRTDACMLIVPMFETLQSGMTLDQVHTEFPPVDDLLGDGALRRPRIIVGLKLYPRHARQLELRFGTEHGTVEATIPNPLPLRGAPPWTPEPIPQSRKVKSREVVLQDLTVHYNHFERVPPDFHIQMKVEVRETGVPPGAFFVRGVFADGTGNESELHPPLGEPVWKLHATVWRTDTYPFTAAEIVASWRTTVPSPGKFQTFQLPDDTALGNRRYLVLAGVGEYRTRYDKTLTFEPAPAPAAGAAQLRAGGNLTLKCAFPQLLIFHQGVPPNDLTYDENRMIIRSVVDGKIQRLFALDYSTASDRERQGYAVGFRGKHTPPVGTEIEFQFINEQAETVDFYVCPPK